MNLVEHHVEYVQVSFPKNSIKKWYIIKKKKPTFWPEFVHTITGGGLNGFKGREPQVERGFIRRRTAFSEGLSGELFRHSPLFRSGISRIFSGRFQQLPVLSCRIRPEIIGKNSENSQSECCFHVPGIFRVSLQDPVAFPHLSWKILRDSVVGTIGLDYIHWFVETEKK